jgi:hypothetical protein
VDWTSCTRRNPRLTKRWTLLKSVVAKLLLPLAALV